MLCVAVFGRVAGRFFGAAEGRGDTDPGLGEEFGEETVALGDVTGGGKVAGCGRKGGGKEGVGEWAAS